MERNNGKIAIAIVAMFVVALSIVGFTYAYFVASVEGNNNTQPSAKVTAGKLEIVYDSTQEIVVENIVPGWENDNNHYYDPVASVYTPADNDLDGDGEYDAGTGETALKVDGKDVKAVKAVTVDPKPANASIETPTELNGKHPRATFSVENADSNGNDAYYGIRFKTINNGLNGEEVFGTDGAKYNDKENFRVTVTNKTTGDALISDVPLIADENGYLMVSSNVITIPSGTKDTYEIKLVYKNEPKMEQDSTNRVVSAVIDVFGVAERINEETGQGTGVWVDADGLVVYGE